MAQTAAPKKILIVEDERGLALGLATLLKSQGYQVVAAEDALYGTSMAHEENVDLVILDLGLPAGGGFTVLKNLKNSVKTNFIPVFILTAKQEKELETKAFEMGAAAFFHKPFNPEQLLGRIKEVFSPNT